MVLPLPKKVWFLSEQSSIPIESSLKQRSLGSAYSGKIEGHLHRERFGLQMMLVRHPWASLTLFKFVMFVGQLCNFLALYSFTNISVISEFCEVYQESFNFSNVCFSQFISTANANTFQ